MPRLTLPTIIKLTGSEHRSPQQSRNRNHSGTRCRKTVSSTKGLQAPKCRVLPEAPKRPTATGLLQHVCGVASAGMLAAALHWQAPPLLALLGGAALLGSPPSSRTRPVIKWKVGTQLCECECVCVCMYVCMYVYVCSCVFMCVLIHVCKYVFAFCEQASEPADALPTNIVDKWLSACFLYFEVPPYYNPELPSLFLGCVMTEWLVSLYLL